MYSKLFSSMYDGTLVSSGPWEALVTFQQLIILADRDGWVDMTVEAISRRTGIPVEVLQKGIPRLMEPDPHSRSEAEGGRRIVPIDDRRPWGWKIVNYQYYRQIRTEEERREYMRSYQRERRRKQKSLQGVDRFDNLDSKQCQPIADADAYTDAEGRKEKIIKKRKVDKVDKPDDLTEQTWNDWQKHRKEKRAPITQTVINQFRSEAKKAETTIEEAVKLSCAQGWQGFKAAWYIRAKNEEPYTWGEDDDAET